MSILSWLEEQRRWSFLALYGDNPRGKEGELWIRCDRCGVVLYLKHLTENYQVCYGCNIHLQMTSKARIEQLIDKETWRTLDNSVSPVDPLLFRDQKGYAARLREAQKRTGLQDALQTGTGLLNGIPVALGVMDFFFMGGSMGSVVGERLTRLAEYATEEGVSLIVVCCSGGARMQEGIFSLMQMAKISAALQVFQANANLLYLSVLTSPTTGGVTASFAMLGDLIISEPKALIGFAGRRIIEQALNEKLPDDFQMAEGLLRHGLIDLIVPRAYLKQAISELLTIYREAPYKRKGSLVYGIRSPLHSAKEEILRRDYNYLKKQLFNNPNFRTSGSPSPFNGIVQVESQLDTIETPFNGKPISCISEPKPLLKENQFSIKNKAVPNLFSNEKSNTSSQGTVCFFSNNKSFSPPQSKISLELSSKTSKHYTSSFVKKVLPYSTEPNGIEDVLKLNSIWKGSETIPLEMSVRIQNYYKNVVRQPKNTLEINYNSFLAAINQKMAIWDSEPTELMSSKEEDLEKAFSKARSTTLLWIGFYCYPNL